MFTIEQIIAYYDYTENDYRKKWGQNSLSLGYWDETTKNLHQALNRMNEIMAEEAAILSSDLVLDAGCGVGGPAVDIAQKIGCKVVGVTLSLRQVDSAQRYAQQNKVQHLVKFQVMDYRKTNFESNSFDVIWARESICHSPNKRDFLKESHRLLKKGGRLIVVDGFKTRNDKNEKESAISRKIMHGFFVWDMDTVDNFIESIKDVGFKHVTSRDITKNVWPSIKYMRRISFPGVLLSPFFPWVKGKLKYRLGNARAAYLLQSAIEQGFFQHQLVRGIK